jgi:hypothetical protein
MSKGARLRRTYAVRVMQRINAGDEYQPRMSRLERRVRARAIKHLRTMTARLVPPKKPSPREVFMASVARGGDLDSMAALYGLTRPRGQTDVDFRKRFHDRLVAAHG